MCVKSADRSYSSVLVADFKHPPPDLRCRHDAWWKNHEGFELPAHRERREIISKINIPKRLIWIEEEVIFVLPYGEHDERWVYRKERGGRLWRTRRRLQHVSGRSRDSSPPWNPWRTRQTIKISTIFFFFFWKKSNKNKWNFRSQTAYRCWISSTSAVMSTWTWGSAWMIWSIFASLSLSGVFRFWCGFLASGVSLSHFLSPRQI